MPQPGFHGKAGSAVLPVLEAEESVNHRMAALDQCGILIPEEVAEDIPVILRIRPREYLPHIIEGVKRFPRIAIGFEQLAGRKFGCRIVS